MLRSVIAAVMLVLLPGQLQGACNGRDIIAQMSPDERAQLHERVERAPFARGNFWRAERGDTVIDIVGTFHIGDPRLASVMQGIAPWIAAAEVVIVEMTPDEERQLADALAADPARAFIIEGPTLRDRLEKIEWQRYAFEMEQRGVPAFVAARFRPWLAFTTLSVPSCIFGMEEALTRGLDERIVTYARELQIPVEGLDRHEMLFALFDLFDPAQALEVLRASLAQAEHSENVLATLSNAYFAGEHRMIWEFSRNWQPADSTAALRPRESEALFDRLEENLLIRRNRNWMTALEPLIAGRRALLAVGAAHLGGDTGLLNLLAQAGYDLEMLTY